MNGIKTESDSVDTFLRDSINNEALEDEIVPEVVNDSRSAEDDDPLGGNKHRPVTQKTTKKDTHKIKSGVPPKKKNPNLSVMCEECGLIFAKHCTLRQHRLTHLGIKNFICDICKNRFTRKYHLEMHMRIHLKIRPHVCEVCARSFSKSSDLTRHRRIHVDAKNYCCLVCERRFKRSSDVISHMRSHTGQKPYSCNPCNKKYSSHSSLTKHLRRYHPNGTNKNLESNDSALVEDVNATQSDGIKTEEFEGPGD